MSAAIPVLLAVSALSFPPAVPETRPWGICHLLGSAAETVELAKETARWRDAGLGGVRVVPIYGAKGWEDRYVEENSACPQMHSSRFVVSMTS